MKGLPELRAQLTRFQKGIVTRAVRNTMMQAGTPILRESKQQCPKERGALRKALRKRFWINESKGRAGVIISVSQTSKTANKSRPQEGHAAPNPRFFIPRNYLHLVVYGAAAHAIKRGARTARKITRIVRGKATTYTQRAAQQAGRMHPGTKPNSFLVRALNISKASALAIVKQGMEAALYKQIAKANAKRP